MPVIRISSLDDERLAVFRDLPKSNLTALSGRFVVEGQLLVERLAASDYATESVVVDERRTNMIPTSLGDDIPIYVLPPSEIEQLIGFNFHRGILACGRRKAGLKWEEFFAADTATRMYVVCVDIQDPTNLGGILRNCAAFGVDGVLLCGATADPFSRRVLRVSMGTAFQLRIGRSSGGLADMRVFQERVNVELVATVLDATAEPLETARCSTRTALLFGNEGYGLGQDWIDASDRRVTLTMDRGTDSLNAAAASAVFLYHFTRVARSCAPIRAGSGD